MRFIGGEYLTSKSNGELEMIEIPEETLRAMDEAHEEYERNLDAALEEEQEMIFGGSMATDKWKECSECGTWYPKEGDKWEACPKCDSFSSSRIVTDAEYKRILLEKRVDELEKRVDALEEAEKPMPPGRPGLGGGGFVRYGIPM